MKNYEVFCYKEAVINVEAETAEEAYEKVLNMPVEDVEDQAGHWDIDYPDEPTAWDE